jgi:hypothetical protein
MQKGGPYLAEVAVLIPAAITRLILRHGHYGVEGLAREIVIWPLVRVVGVPEDPLQGPIEEVDLEA